MRFRCILSYIMKLCAIRPSVCLTNLNNVRNLQDAAVRDGERCGGGYCEQELSVHIRGVAVDGLPSHGCQVSENHPPVDLVEGIEILFLLQFHLRSSRSRRSVTEVANYFDSFT